MQRSCRHLLVDEFQDLTPAHVLLLRLLALPGARRVRRRRRRPVHLRPRRRRPGVPHRLRRGCSPAPASTRCTVNYRCPVEVVDGARTLLGYNHRRVAKQIDAGPASDDARPARCAVVEHGRDDGATALVDVGAGLARRARRRAVVDRRARPRQLAAAGAPRRACTRPACRSSSVLRPDVLERTGMRAALAYLRIATAAGRRSTTDDVVEILRRPTRGLPQWFPERLAAARHVDARRQLAGARRPGAGQGRRARCCASPTTCACVVDAGRSRHDARRPGGRPRRRRPRRGDEPARPHRRRPGVEPPRRPRRPARRRRPAPRPGRLRAVAARGVPARGRPRTASRCRRSTG